MNVSTSLWMEMATRERVSWRGRSMWWRRCSRSCLAWSPSAVASSEKSKALVWLFHYRVVLRHPPLDWRIHPFVLFVFRLRPQDTERRVMLWKHLQTLLETYCHLQQNDQSFLVEVKYIAASYAMPLKAFYSQGSADIFASWYRFTRFLWTWMKQSVWWYNRSSLFRVLSYDVTLNSWISLFINSMKCWSLALTIVGSFAKPDIGTFYPPGGRNSRTVLSNVAFVWCLYSLCWAESWHLSC